MPQSYIPLAGWSYLEHKVVVSSKFLKICYFMEEKLSNVASKLINYGSKVLNCRKFLHCSFCEQTFLPPPWKQFWGKWNLSALMISKVGSKHAVPFKLSFDFCFLFFSPSDTLTHKHNPNVPCNTIHTHSAVRLTGDRQRGAFHNSLTAGLTDGQQGGNQ